MADSTPNIALGQATWIDLYAASGIAVGTQIIVTNVGRSECRLYAAASAPAQANQGIPLPVYTEATNEAGDTGAWIYSVQGGRVNVREA